jgi:hypothetical protein
MFQILLHHFIGDIAATPHALSNRPEMIAPVSLFKLWKFSLQQTRRATFQAFDQIRESQFRRVFDVHMHVVFADDTRQNANILGITNLNEQISTTSFYIAFKDVIAILCTPNKMCGQARNRMVTVPIIFHLPPFSHEILAEAN